MQKELLDRLASRNTSHSKSLDNKVALIVGGSRGIGRAVAISLANEGADIVISYLRNEVAAKETASRIRKIGRRVMLYRMDLGRCKEIGGMFGEIRKEYGRLDILIYSAALGIFKPLLSLSPLQLGRVLDINAIGFVQCTKQASELMRDGGSVVAISSLGSQRYFYRYGALGLAKSCIESAVRYLAVELAPQKICVNCVSGGPVDTESIQLLPLYKKRRAECIRLTPAGRIAVPKDIAQVVLFLCKETSSWIRGQTIVADGGLSLRVMSL